MESNFFEALKWIITFGAGVFVLLMAYWGRTMSEEIKTLKADYKNHEVLLAILNETLKSRDEIQKERWANQNSKTDIIQKDVQFLVHQAVTKNNVQIEQKT